MNFRERRILRAIWERNEKLANMYHWLKKTPINTWGKRDLVFQQELENFLTDLFAPSEIIEKTKQPFGSREFEEAFRYRDKLVPTIYAMEEDPFFRVPRYRPNMIPRFRADRRSPLSPIPAQLVPTAAHSALPSHPPTAKPTPPKHPQRPVYGWKEVIAIFRDQCPGKKYSDKQWKRQLIYLAQKTNFTYLYGGGRGTKILVPREELFLWIDRLNKKHAELNEKTMAKKFSTESRSHGKGQVAPEISGHITRSLREGHHPTHSANRDSPS